MLTVNNLTKNFGSIQAVKDLSFTVNKGEVLGFLGPNGAGKSTSMRMITGFIPPTSGTAKICGYDIVENSVEAKKCLGYLPESAPLYNNMKVSEFLNFIGSIRGYEGKSLKSKIEEVITKSRLEPVYNRTIENLSKGYRQRTCFAQAIFHNPQVLIMDEPTDGLDPNQKYVVRQMIKEMSEDKVIVVSTHILEEVDAVCSRVIVIADGQLVANCTPDELRAQDPNGQMDVVFRKLTLKEDSKND